MALDPGMERTGSSVEGAEEELSEEPLRYTMEGYDLDVVMAMRTLEAVEKDAQGVAASLSSLLSALQSGLSNVTSSSVKHLECYNDVAGHVQETALDAAMKGNKFINACLRLNEEMKGMGVLARQIKVLRQTVDYFDNQVSRLLSRS
ncbi:hypothetical protein KP509_36G028900 [Ceratopteris richardii]|uniref:BLOC-1-related complex subunit 6 C-terminal helix domain-containing protein n=1 Tax=Ceratopteris richardii TaxID=49495 RepID=A0A8T2QB91_CERRI|nr:hypothetical protein KP509_36G028900 [Ceratopteris richardii]